VGWGAFAVWSFQGLTGQQSHSPGFGWEATGTKGGSDEGL